MIILLLTIPEHSLFLFFVLLQRLVAPAHGWEGSANSPEFGPHIRGSQRFPIHLQSSSCPAVWFVSRSQPSPRLTLTSCHSSLGQWMDWATLVLKAHRGRNGLSCRETVTATWACCHPSRCPWITLGDGSPTPPHPSHTPPASPRHGRAGPGTS